ncbi:ABC transporter permease [Prochlorococcus sp. MIT 1300]|uniref:ABC transporter permease n=1 Tax=Prochlorococcus sp. MIT 1300 TaxID=3096218 RepID=UPI002A749C18|nr:ABC transporter permease [Prochlorococcus sp. MIT 1300]
MAKERALFKYCATRIALTPLMLWLISTLVFLMLRVAPGDPVDAILGNRANEAARFALRTRLGLDKPLWEQYLNFIGGLLKGKLGESLTNQEPVKEIIAGALPATIELGTIALLIAICIGIVVGFSGAAKRESKIDLLGRVFGISTYALPPFWAAMMMQLLFAVHLGWLPVGGRFPPSLITPQGSGFLILDSFLAGDWLALQGTLRHLFLPALTLGILLSGIFSRSLRLNLGKALKADYIEAARSRGISEKKIITKHALPNALLPVLTIAGITIASLIGGALLIEVTFSWPGIALKLQEAISQRDYPVVQGIVVVIASLVVLISVLIDLVIAVIDPRVQY